MQFIPTAKYGDWSYQHAVLVPIVEALNSAALPATHM